LALAIEAAATANRADAAALAAEYLTRFPAGRFTGLARQTRRRFAR
jgi:hypothetical protein